jgi:hypothetical protein
MEIIRKEKTDWKKIIQFEKKNYVVKSYIPYPENPEIIYARYTAAELEDWLSKYSEYGEIIISIEPEITY